MPLTRDNIVQKTDTPGVPAPVPVSTPTDPTGVDALTTPVLQTRSASSRKRPLVHFADRIFGKVLCITPEKMETILSVLGGRLGLTSESIPAKVVAWMDDDEDDDEEDDDEDEQDQKKPYDIIDGCIACIPVSGTLVKRGGFMNALSGMTGYESLQSCVEMAMQDDDACGIIFDVDSPGGETDGLFDLCDYMYAMRGTKPMYACINDQMCSAAYAIGSCADQIYVTRTGMAGSVGCFMLHVSQVDADAKAGLKYTYIQAGDKKTEGNPHEPLSDGALSTMQSEVNRIRDMFVTMVARNRNVTAQQVIDTQAGVMFADAAIPLFADKLGTMSNARADMLAQFMMADMIAKAAADAQAAQGAQSAEIGDKEDYNETDQGMLAPQQPAQSTVTTSHNTMTFINWPSATYDNQSIVSGTSPSITLMTDGTYTISIPSIPSISAAAIPYQKTSTTDSAWDGPANEARLKNDQNASYYRKYYAWQETGSDGTKKSQFKMGHHQVSGSGDIGAANVNGCRAVIANLNGARSAPKIPSSDRQGIYNHVAHHLRDAGLEPAPLKSEVELSAIAESLSNGRFVHFATDASLESDLPKLMSVSADMESIVIQSSSKSGGCAYEFEYSPAASNKLFGQSTPVTLAIRSIPECRATVSPDSRRIRMLLAPYGDQSINLGGFKEIYQRDCFSQGLDSDPRACFNHDSALILGRKSAGTAKFWEDERGLWAEADAPETTWANDLLVSLRRGDITQSSAAFWILQSRWEVIDGTRVRIVEKARLNEGGPQAFAAYETSTARVQSAPAVATAATAATSTTLVSQNPAPVAQPASVIAIDSGNSIELAKARLKVRRLR